jgi:hypothetical protein
VSRKLKLRDRVHTDPKQVPVIGQMNPVNIPITNFLWAFQWRFPSTPLSINYLSHLQNYVHFSRVPIYGLRPVYFIFHLLISLILLEEEYKLWSISQCNLFQLPVTSSHWAPNILSSLISKSWFTIFLKVWEVGAVAISVHRHQYVSFVSRV